MFFILAANLLNVTPEHFSSGEKHTIRKQLETPRERVRVCVCVVCMFATPEHFSSGETYNQKAVGNTSRESECVCVVCMFAKTDNM